jgi:hypothetical protein
MSKTDHGEHGLLDLKRALGRWDNEGGATVDVSPGSPALALQASDRQLVSCLGAAVVLRWNHLPTEIQRDLFRSAASMADPGLQQELTQRLGRYLHQQAVD